MPRSAAGVAGNWWELVKEGSERDGEKTRWRQVEPGVIEAGWKMSGILLFKQNTATFGTPEKSSSLRLKTLSREQIGLFTHRWFLKDKFRE